MPRRKHDDDELTAARKRVRAALSLKEYRTIDTLRDAMVAVIANVDATLRDAGASDLYRGHVRAYAALFHDELADLLNGK